jgi:hypothetical protein
MSEYRTTIGRISEDRKVHLAHGVDAQHILCRHGAARLATAITIAEVPDDADTCDVLLANEVKLSHLCLHCFSIRLRARYRALIQAAIAAC